MCCISQRGRSNCHSSNYQFLLQPLESFQDLPSSFHYLARVPIPVCWTALN
ncbi:rCG31724 [Rattus norvegicus]|uniref:RCG31724 n=1 Tax=Rattus norvegicus TaxID=10116 RepID=A6JN65_RAT|nr:rCG31724 [Rattus norvegicus]